MSGNQIEFVNIQNGVNSDISNFNSTNNPNLTCVQVDDVNTVLVQTGLKMLPLSIVWIVNLDKPMYPMIILNKL